MSTVSTTPFLSPRVTLISKLHTGQFHTPFDRRTEKTRIHKQNFTTTTPEAPTHTDVYNVSAERERRNRNTCIVCQTRHAYQDVMSTQVYE